MVVSRHRGSLQVFEDFRLYQKKVPSFVDCIWRYTPVKRKLKKRCQTSSKRVYQTTCNVSTQTDGGIEEERNKDIDSLQLTNLELNDQLARLRKESDEKSQRADSLLEEVTELKAQLVKI